MPTPKPPPRIPLGLIDVICTVCGNDATALEVSKGLAVFHTKDGTMVRFPKGGLTDAEIEELRAKFLRCESCQEEYEEKIGPPNRAGR